MFAEVIIKIAYFFETQYINVLYIYINIRACITSDLVVAFITYCCCAFINLINNNN